MVAVEAALDPSLVLRRDARDALQSGDLDTALRLFDSVVAQLGSGDAQHLADARCERGVVLSRRAATQADGKAKERDLRAALSDCPQQRVLIEALANAVLLRARDLGDAAETRVLRRALLEESMTLHPTAAAAVDLARLCDQADDVVCATAAAERAVTLAPDDARVRTLRDGLKRHGDAEAGFQSARHQHFVARFEGYGEQRLAWGALDVLERAWFTVGHSLDLRPTDPVTVVIYTGEKYAQATATPDWSSGVFDGKIRIREGQLQAERGNLEDTLVHEYVHAALRNCVPGEIPPWFHEGLAQQQEQNKYDVKGLVARTGKAPMSALNAPFLTLNEADARAAYATALWMVETLVQQRGIYGLRQLLAEMKQGKSFDDALQNAFMTTSLALWSSLS